MEIETYQVDAFTTQAFGGNPAAVCIVSEPLNESLMRSIAQEMAVSETAFFNPKTGNLKWFTPEVEVALCGHGTLATVEVMRHKDLLNEGDAYEFQTLSGPLTARVSETGITLDFPVPEIIATEELDSSLISALGIGESEVLFSASFDNKQLLVVNSEHKVRNLKPDFQRLISMPGRGVVVTAQSKQDDLDFISRYFAPWVGVNEDPVTGSAHCALTQYWSKILNKREFTAYQASERGGYLKTRLKGARVELIGRAKIVLSGTLYL